MTAEETVGTVLRTVSAPLNVVYDRTPVRKLEFVDVDPTPVKPRRRVPAGGAASEVIVAPEAAESPAPIDPGEGRWSLWSDAEV